MACKLWNYASKDEVGAVIESSISILGHAACKPEQKEAVTNVLEGKDVFVSVPTGYGKSAIFQMVPTCAKKLLAKSERGDIRHPAVLVISPLVSLITDQVNKLEAVGLSAVHLSSQAHNDHGNEPLFRDILEGPVSHIFTSPEAILDTKWRSLLLKPTFVNRIVVLVVDEAHCISKWGYQFRRAYSQIAQLRSFLPTGTPVLALTATAAKSTEKVIVDSLHLCSNYVTVRKSPDRPNIHYSVIRAKRDVTVSFQWLVLMLQQERLKTPKVIIFCRSINSCVAIYKYFLTTMKESSYELAGQSQPSCCNCLFAMFHARVDVEDKQSIISSFCTPSGVCRVIISTIAFGMGVDVPDIRTVIHYGPSSGIEEYVQESGRAGRDGQPSKAILCIYPGCLLGHVSKEMKTYCQINTTICRRKQLLSQFNTSPNSQVTKCCDICSGVEENSDLFNPRMKEVSEPYLTDDDEDDRLVSSAQRELLKEKLIELRSRMLHSGTQSSLPLYTGSDLATGLPSSLIDSLVENCHKIHTEYDLDNHFAVWHSTKDIMTIIDSVLS